MEVQINIDNWKFKDFRKYIKAAKDLDIDALLANMMGMIVSWSFPSDPQVEASYDNLTMPEWIQLTRLVNTEISKKFETKN